jgi:toxin ParE1/3/4
VKLSWARTALRDRHAIYDHIESDNPRAAASMDELFSKRAHQLLDHPAMGRLGRVEGTRELVVHKNYILIYDLKADHIRILRVLHAAQMWP